MSYLPEFCCCNSSKTIEWRMAQRGELKRKNDHHHHHYHRSYCHVSPHSSAKVLSKLKSLLLYSRPPVEHKCYAELLQDRFGQMGPSLSTALGHMVLYNVQSQNTLN